MSQQTINVGAAPNDGTGTPLRTAFQYTNSNFSELYTALGGGSGLPGSNGQVLFNNGTAIAGDAGLTYNPATDALTITGDLTVRTNKLAVTSTGVGFGLTSPSQPIDVVGSISSRAATTGSNQDVISIRALNNDASAYANAVYYANSQKFCYNGSSVGATLDSSGNLGLGVTPSAGGGVLQLKSGITFPATQVASSDANTLDDYEEGTWTGTLGGSTANPTTPVTATGKYTKIGRQVSIQIAFVSVDTTGASNRILLTGLPFAASSSPDGITGSVLFDSMATFTGSPGVYLTQGTTQIDIYSSVSNSGLASVTHNAGSARYLWLNVTYTV